MTALGCWLLVVGVSDLFRARRDLTSGRRRAVLAAGSLAGLLAAALLAQPTPLGWLAWGLGAAGAVAWLVGSGAALSAGSRTRRTLLGSAAGSASAWPALAGPLAYAALGVALAGFVLAGDRAGRAEPLADLLDGSALGAVPVAGAAMVAGAVAVQLSTANIAIRLMLDQVGVPAGDNEKQLRGGRVLGPMERVVILGFGLAGSLTGAALVVAAKALLRFPELRADAESGRTAGPSDVTEYFLLGSFASWLIALGGIALCALAL